MPEKEMGNYILTTDTVNDRLVNKKDMLAAVFTGDLNGLVEGVITVELEQE